MQVIFGFIITGIIGYAGTSLVQGVEQNTPAVKSLEKAVVDLNLATNGRINNIDRKLEVGREKSISAFKEMKYKLKSNTIRLDKLEKKHEAN